jgi:hypothetical protein
MRIKYPAIVLALIWAGWWTFFCIASAISEGSDSLAGWIHTAPGFIFLLTAVIAWRWEMVGGILLIVEAVGGMAFFGIWPFGSDSMMASLFLLLTLALPPLAAGIMLLVSKRVTSKPKAA